jgi:hypothetical protein
VDHDILYSLTLPDWELRKLPLHGPRQDCLACCGSYDYFDGTLDNLAASACAPDRAEAEAGPLDLGSLAGKLSEIQGWELAQNAFCLVFSGGGLRYTLFPGGKVVQEGSGDASRLRAFISEYIGT